MTRRNQQTFISWRFLFLFVISLLLTTFPVSHQITIDVDESTFEGSPSVTTSEDKIDEKRVVFEGCGGVASSSHIPVQLIIQHGYVIIDNGIVQITLSKPEGHVTGISYNGIDNVLETRNNPDNRGYWDLNFDVPRHDSYKKKKESKHEDYDRIKGTEFRVITEDENQVELSFLRSWDPSMQGKYYPMNIDKRFGMLRGCSGFYSYGIYERLEGWPVSNLTETRIAFKLSNDKFNYMAVSDARQRLMPTVQDRSSGHQLAYPEAVLLTNPTNPLFKGEVDDKYQYSCENKDNRVHGWISSDHSVGFWVITPSDEFRTGGPLKQDLTSHVGPTALAMFVSSHYAGEALELRFEEGEPWKKVFGPVLIYLNSAVSLDGKLNNPYQELWEDAKHQMIVEVENWPYNFPASEDYLKSDQRGAVSGKLVVHNRYSNKEYFYASSAYVGLAPLGNAGSWQNETKGYQFWTNADANGTFSIRNVRKGDYNLFAWVPGFIGDYRYNVNLTILPGSDINLGVLIFDPPRDGPTIWEIGFPDRSAAEFFIPNPDPRYINRLYVDHRTDREGKILSSVDKFRQYGLWKRYAEMYPHEDLVYTIGLNDYSKDWFYAQVPRRIGAKEFKKTTWKIKFDLVNVDQTGTYTLWVALASATYAELQVRINNENDHVPHFTTHMIGRDNAVARHGIHGLYSLFHVNVSSSRLVQGQNTIFLTQARNNSAFRAIMYDYIRLEGPSMLYI
ncbi:rhamnogalacturonate lyase B-like isoform X2 [Papaver somniferum]|nr:rhamnogalacturonate lyase B-like isoform X2 [Papaver somniferum]XP_026432926.1 rhamnogalacturonate lyase B-like isoform X2 [Papaver somniferum]